MTTIVINPDRLKQFGPPEDSTFCLVTNSALISNFRIENDHYDNSLIIPFDNNDSFNNLLDQVIPACAHILVIMPDCYFHSPTPDKLGKRRKLSIMANNSTPTSLDTIKHFIQCAEQIDPKHLDRVANKFFEFLENTQRISFVDDTYQTEAIFSHTKDSLQWHEQAGSLDWGQQQLFPSGEISVLPVDVYGMDIISTLELNGEITLKGYPILHSGKTSYLAEDQERIFKSLSVLNDHPIIATVIDGIITDIQATHNNATSTLNMLNALFDVDSRYRTIIEIGFGINHWVKLVKANSAMNEVHAAHEGGSVHWGVGLTPYTQYHLDLICPNTMVINDKNQIIFGKSNPNFKFENNYAQ